MSTEQESILDIFSTITESVDSTSLALDNLLDLIATETHSPLIEQLLKETQTKLPEGVSLLTLKNSSMLSYLNNLILVILSNIERLETNEDEEEFKQKRLRIIKNSIVQRVTMERGVKGLENRLNYQFDKMTKAYDRINEKSTTVKHVENVEEEEEEDSEDEDISSYRPDASSLAASLQLKKKKEGLKSSSSASSASQEKYKPPRITPALPPSAITNDNAKVTKTRKLQSMEEFLREQGDAPILEESIGSTILQHGRGGIKTSRDKQKEEEIQRYEESNFVRLNELQLNGNSGKKRRARQDLNVFGGEDFGMFNNKDRDINESASRKKKSMSAWDRAKRKRL